MSIETIFETMDYGTAPEERSTALQWIKDHGGIEWIEQINNQKSELIYNEIDRNPLFEGVSRKEDRSNMNVTFTLTDSTL